MADPGHINDLDLTPERAEALDALLGAPRVWADTPPGLVEGICAAIGAKAESVPVDHGVEADDRRFRHRVVLIGAAVVIALAAVVGSLLGTRDGGQGDPDAVELALSGTDLAPDATAVAELSDRPSGLRIRLDVEGLPPAPAGSFYEAWVRNDDGGISAGTFHLRGGDGSIELWAGVSADDFPTMTVTLEDVAGGPESSGQVVLVGSLEPAE